MNTEKPKIVKTAQIILWITLGIGIIRSVIELPKLLQQPSFVGDETFAYFVLLFVFVLLSTLTYFIGKRKNWARWTYTFLVIFGIPLSPMLIQSFQYETVSGIFGMIQLVAQIIAMIFLFLTPSRDWFKRQTEQKIN